MENPSSSSSCRFERDRPKILAFCSIKDGGRVQNFESIEYLQYLHERSWNNIGTGTSALDLKAGFSEDTFKPKKLCEKLSGIEAWYRHDPEQLSAALRAENPVFLTFCGSFQTISLMKAPNQKEWVMYATKYRNLIFLCEKKNRETSEVNVRDYMGPKCEQYLLSDDPEKPPNTSGPLHSQEEFCLLLSNRLNGKELIYGAEIDGIRRNKRIDETETSKDEILQILNDPSTTTIIEIKSVPEKCIYKLDEQNVNRSSKFYVQCLLTGCKEVYLAGKKRSGRVTKTKRVKTDDLPKGRALEWTPQNCIMSLDEVLDLILKEFAGKDDFSTLKIEWKPDQHPHPPRMAKPDESDDYKLLSHDFEDYLRKFSTAPQSTPGNEAEREQLPSLKRRVHNDELGEVRNKVSKK